LRLISFLLPRNTTLQINWFWIFHVIDLSAFVVIGHEPYL
jgi:hypothetical protein